MLVSATLVLLVFLLALSWIIERAYRESLLASEKEQLRLHVHSLLVEAEPEDYKLALPEYMQDQRLNQLNSGLYGVVMSNTEEVWRSHSADFLVVDLPHSLKQGEIHFSELPSSSDGRLFCYGVGVTWEFWGGQEKTYTFYMLETKREYNLGLKKFRRILAIWLSTAAFALLVVQVIVMRWGLSPLSDLAAGLAQIEEGKSDKLEGQFPSELEGITDNLNLLVSNERIQRERYRNTMSDLAHSLKTPLAILKGIDFDSDESDQIRKQVCDQVERMNQIVTYQLQRAVAASPHSVLQGIDVKPVIEKIIGALQKVYRDADKQVELDLNDGQFFGDEGDLMELAGNLIDNAFKYGGKKIKVKVGAIPQSHHKKKGLEIVVEDNGAGIPDDQKESILNRGTRIDTQMPGQGIGMAIVRDIVNSYHGTLKIADSPMGGAMFILRFVFEE